MNFALIQSRRSLTRTFIRGNEARQHFVLNQETRAMSDCEKLIADLDLVEVRDFCEEDVGGLVKYWYHSPLGYIEGLGIDPGKLLPEQEFRTWLIGECSANSQRDASKSHLLTITYGGRAIGNHALSPLFEGDYGVFHAHICGRPPWSDPVGMLVHGRLKRLGMVVQGQC